MGVKFSPIPYHKTSLFFSNDCLKVSLPILYVINQYFQFVALSSSKAINLTQIYIKNTLILNFIVFVNKKTTEFLNVFKMTRFFLIQLALFLFEILVYSVKILKLLCWSSETCDENFN